jgi:hypothetical protein
LSFTPLEEFAPQSLRVGDPNELFSHEIRRGPRPIVLLRGFETADGTVVVETDVYPVGGDVDDGLRGQFPFPNRSMAARFVDDTLMALELLSCEIA